MPTSLRLLSVDAGSVGRRRADLAKLISDAAPDVACVHGSPHLLRWRSISAALARRAGLVVVCGGRTAGANLVLSGLGVDVTAVRELRLRGGSPARRPGAALAAMRLRGTGFLVASASLVGNAAERLAQAGELQAAIESLVPGELPALVSAQGSDRAGTSAWQALVENRAAIGGRIFVDSRVSVTATEELSGAAIQVELTL